MRFRAIPAVVLLLTSGYLRAEAGGLSKEEAARAREEIWSGHVARLKAERADEMKARSITIDGRTMKWEVVDFPEPEGTDGAAGAKPAGRRLFISMHGGGNAPPRVNESQWRNQVRLAQLYRPSSGIYLAPRAPTDTWNLWHEAHIDDFFGRIISALVALEDVDPDRVYLLGYSAGGDGVYQVAPRTADRWAAVAMMAGHPNEALPDGLRNLPIILQVGEQDNGFARNRVIREWEEKLLALQKEDPDGYRHRVVVHAGLGHWMNGEDRIAIPWMEQFVRNPLPDRVVWRQDDVVHDRLYWLAVRREDAAAGREVRARRSGQTITIEKADVPRVTILLNDAMLNLDEPVNVVRNGRNLFSGVVPRRPETISRTLAERGDPRLVFCAEVTVDIPEAEPRSE